MESIILFERWFQDIPGWHYHLVAAQENDFIKIYLDGALVSETPMIDGVKETFEKREQT